MSDTGIEHRNWEWLTASQRARDKGNREKEVKGKSGKKMMSRG